MFAGYARSGIWTAVHVGQFACTGSLGLESGINWLYAPGLVTFDMSLQKEFSAKERFKIQLRVDAFNVFNHPNFYRDANAVGLNTTLNFTSYPNPAIANNATPYNGAGQLVNVTGFGAVTVPAPGSAGSARILQTLIRVQF